MNGAPGSPSCTFIDDRNSAAGYCGQYSQKKKANSVHEWTRLDDAPASCLDFVNPVASSRTKSESKAARCQGSAMQRELKISLPFLREG
jgi:hypothetical protein